MPSAERARDRGHRYARELIARLGAELREARISAGLSQAAVARAAGMSQSSVSKTEGGRRARLAVGEVTRHAAVLGLRISMGTFPVGGGVRDTPQLRVIERLRPEVGTGFRWFSEVLIGGPGDHRAWDVMLVGPGRVGIDAETRLHDIQAVQRRSEAKRRDSGVDRIILLVSDTAHNRAVLREHRQALYSTFPADTAEILRALREGRLPDRNGIVVC
jgi:transcriptional regulator with XRE-family HTH domain